MRNRHYDIHEQSGVSVIETLVVVVIISIIVGIALMQGGSANTQFQRQNVARELKVQLERARFDSVKRHAEGAGPAKVVVNTNSYTLYTDSNNDGTFETPVTDFAAQNISIKGYVSMTLPVTIVFNRRGEATALDYTTAAVNPQFLVCNGTCPETPTTSTANLIIVTPTGTVNLLGGGASPPSFAAPNVSDVSVGTGISNIVAVP